MSTIVNILCIVIVSLFSISFHEFMHGYVSYRLGDPTARAMGRLTLNPIKHIDPIGLLMMIFARIGWAKPVPINPAYYRNRKAGTILVSIAGPLSNLMLAFVFTLPTGWMNATYDLSGAWAILIGSATTGAIGIMDTLFLISYYFVVLNIGLAIFNLLPIPPLDGSKVLSGVLPTETYFKFMRYERYIGIAFLAIVILVPGFLNNIIMPVEEFVMNLFLGIWTPVLSLFT
jgi:Zn-dependent protease